MSLMYYKPFILHCVVNLLRYQMYYSFREAEKKSFSLNGRAIKALPPSPSSLILAVEILERW